MVRWGRPGKGGFNSLVILDTSLVAVLPNVLEIKTERRCAMEIECLFCFHFKRKLKNKKVTVVVEDEQ